MGGSIRLAAGSVAAVVVVVIGSLPLTRFDPRAPRRLGGVLIVRAAIGMAVGRDPTGSRCVLPTRAGEVWDHNTPRTRGLLVSFYQRGCDTRRCACGCGWVAVHGPDGEGAVFVAPPIGLLHVAAHQSRTSPVAGSTLRSRSSSRLA